MSFRGRNSSRFRRSRSHDRPFRGRGRSNDRFHRRDFDGQIEITDRGRRGRGFSKHFDGPNLRSPRSHHLRGRYQYKKNRGRNMDSFRHCEERAFRRFSPERSRSPNEWVGEESTHFSDDDQEFNHSRRRFHSPEEWLDDCDDVELLEDSTRHSNGRPISPLIIHRNFEREDYENARQRSLERRERTPLSDRSMSLERNPFCGIQERMSNRRSRSPFSMRSFRGDTQVFLGRPRSQQSTYSVRRQDFERNRSLERPRSHTSSHSRRYRRDVSSHSCEIRRPNSKLSFRSGCFKNRDLLQSPDRFLGRRPGSRFSIRSRSFERMSCGRRSNSGFSVQSGSLKRHAIKRSHKGLITRSRSPFSSHSRDCERESFKRFDTRSYNRPDSSFKQTRSFERDDFPRDKSLPRRFSPASRQSYRERSPSFKQHHSQSFEHQRRYHEKRSESSIERFLNDCKQSVEGKQDLQSEPSYRSRRKFKGLDHIVVERGQSFERSVSPVEIMLRSDNMFDGKVISVEKKKSVGKRSDIPHSSKSQRLKQKSEVTENRLSPILNESGGIEKTETSQHSSDIKTKEDNSNVSPDVVLSSPEDTKCVKKAEVLNTSDLTINDENCNLSPISKSSIFEKIELAERKDLENRLSPISSQSGSMGEKELTKTGDVGQGDLNLSPISQYSSFSKDRFSVKSTNLSLISQAEWFEDENSNDNLPTRKRKTSDSNDSMQEFLAELERDEISHEEKMFSPKQEVTLGKPYEVVLDKISGGWKRIYTPGNKEEQSGSVKKYHNTKEIGSLSRKAYFEVSNNDIKQEGHRQIHDAYPNKSLEAHTEPPTYSLSHTLCSYEKYIPQNKNFTMDQAMKNSKISYPLRPNINTSFHLPPQTQLFGQNPQLSSMENAYNPSSQQNVLGNSKPSSLSYQHSSTQLLRNPYLSLQEIPDQTVNNMHCRIGNLNTPFSNNLHQNVNERDNLHHIEENSQQMSFQPVSNRHFGFQSNAYESQNNVGRLYQNTQYQRPSPQFPHNFGVSIQAPSNNSLISTGNNAFNQEENKLLPHSEMPQHFKMEAFQLQTKPSEFQVPQWQRNPESNPLVTSLTGNNFPTANLSLGPEPIWPKWPNQNQPYFAGTLGQNQPHQKAEKSENNRSNLKLVFDFFDTRSKTTPVKMEERQIEASVQNTQNTPVQNMSHSVSSSFDVKPQQKSNEIQVPSSHEQLQPTWSFKDKHSNLNLPIQSKPELTKLLKTTPTLPDPVNIKKYLAPVFGRNYFSVVFPQTKEVITISDDEDVNIKSDAQSKDQNQITKPIMKIVQNLVPSPVFVEKYRDVVPSPEDLKQMFETFVIYFGVRNNSQLEKDPFFVIQESFSRSQGFGPLQVEENEEYHDFLPVPKQ